MILKCGSAGGLDAAVTVRCFYWPLVKYPYPQYSFIRGGDGGMEPP
jgi:hypothetical protein